MAVRTSPMDRMLANFITTWFIINTARINDKFEDCTVAIQTGIVCWRVPHVIITSQDLLTICFYEGLNWNQQPVSEQQNNTWNDQHISTLAVWLYLYSNHACTWYVHFGPHELHFHQRQFCLTQRFKGIINVLVLYYIFKKSMHTNAHTFTA